jgi:REP element-mobilizing transposase RayT
MGRSRRQLPDGCSFHITLRCNSRAFLMARGVRRDLPRIMQWIGWYSAMALNRLTVRCGHFWEARYFSTPIEPGDRRRVLATLRTIHAKAKAAGVRRGFHDPWSNYGHYERLVGDGLSEWHPAFLQLAPTLEGCARRYAHFCRRYRPRAKPARKTRWGGSATADGMASAGGELPASQ